MSNHDDEYLNAIQERSPSSAVEQKLDVATEKIEALHSDVRNMKLWLAILGTAFLAILALIFTRSKTRETPKQKAETPAEKDPQRGVNY